MATPRNWERPGQVGRGKARSALARAVYSGIIFPREVISVATPTGVVQIGAARPGSVGKGVARAVYSG